MFHEKAREFQKGFDCEERRRGREEERLRLRKLDRNLKIDNKRRKPHCNTDNKNYSTLQNNENNNNNHNNSNTNHNANAIKLSRLSTFVSGCYSNEITVQFESLQGIRKLLSLEKDPPVNDVIQTGVLPRVMQLLLNNKFPKLQFEASWLLCNITAGEAEHTAAVIRQGAVPNFIQLISTSSSLELVDQIIWCLGNIAGNSIECRDLVLNHNGLNIIVKFISTLLPMLHSIFSTQFSYKNIIDVHNDEIALFVKEKLNHMQIQCLENVAWALSNIVCGKPSPHINIVKKHVVVTCILLQCRIPQITHDLLWSMTYVTKYENDNSDSSKALNEELMEMIMETGMLKYIIRIFGDESLPLKLKHPALRIIGNIVASDNEKLITFCVENDFTKICCNILNKTETSKSTQQFKRDICWTLSNITASKNHIQDIFQNNLISPLISTMNCGYNDVSREATFALCNIIICGSHQQISTLLGYHFVASLRRCFERPYTKKSLMILLETIQCIMELGVHEEKLHSFNQYTQMMEENNIISHLEEILSLENTNNDVINKINELFSKYFEKNTFDNDNMTMDEDTYNDNNHFNNNNHYNGTNDTLYDHYNHNHNNKHNHNDNYNNYDKYI